MSEQIECWETLIASRTRPCATMPKYDSLTMRKKFYNRQYKKTEQYRKARKTHDRKYRQAHRNERNEYNRKYRAEHRDYYQSYCREWRARKKTENAAA